MVNSSSHSQSQHARVKHAVGLGIVRGAYRSGELLPHEQELTAELGVSRSVWREAMRTLAAKGLVQSKQRVGTRVTDRQQWNLLDDDVIAWHTQAPMSKENMLRQVVEARLVIEPAAASLAAEHGNADSMAAVTSALEDMVNAGPDLEVYLDADIAFHRAIYHAGKNELIGQMGEILLGALRVSHNVTAHTPDPIQRSLPLHKAVARAIERRSASAAHRAMTRLIESATEDIQVGLENEAEGGSA